MKLFLRVYILLVSFGSFSVAAQKLSLTPFASGLSAPIDIKNCGDDRLFIAERAGRIRVVKPGSGVLSTPMLDIISKVSGTTCEEGFLGIAFSPTHKTDRKLYVNYTANISGLLHTIIEEYKVSTSDSNVVDPASALELFRIRQPFCNHNGGNMMFGKDSMLYIFLGDGGSGGDPNNNGQSKTTYLGKILRVDIRNSSVSQPYLIPPSNPFYHDNTTGIKKEIWAYGLRNPWRGSTDRITGDIWIGDVGQGAREEIDFQPASSPGGVNYGWKIMEGTACYSPPTGCSTAGLQLPIYDYGRTNGYSVTGGNVHRSAQSKYLFGMYIFSDLRAWIDGFRQNNGAMTGSVERLMDASLAPGQPIGYGEDKFGDLYLCFHNVATVYRISDSSYLRRPKAYILSTQQSGPDFLLKGLQGSTVTYQWLKNGIPVPGATSPDFTTTGAGTYQLELTNEINRKDTSDPFSLAILSATLKDFKARRNRNAEVEMSWITATENNISGFEVQRRKKSETSFSTIGFVSTKSVNGNSSSELQYNFTDINNLKNELLYYQVKMVDKNGGYTLSEIKSVQPDNGKGYTILYNSTEVVINFNDILFPVIVNLYEVNGKRLRSAIISTRQYSIDLRNLKGVYLLELIDKNGKLGSEKLIVH